jgi:hypothetical protein
MKYDMLSTLSVTRSKHRRSLPAASANVVFVCSEQVRARQRFAHWHNVFAVAALSHSLTSCCCYCCCYCCCCCRQRRAARADAAAAFGTLLSELVREAVADFDAWLPKLKKDPLVRDHLLLFVV